MQEMNNYVTYIYNEFDYSKAIEKTTHLAIVAHPDDIEIIAYNGIMECLYKSDKWFSGVVVTDGAGCSKNGICEDKSDDFIRKLRKEEQIKAAIVGEYSYLMMLDFSSSDVNPKDIELVKFLEDIIYVTKPDIIYTHNPFDSHITHIKVMFSVVNALRNLKSAYIPKKIYGCEVWGSLDWVSDEYKVRLPVEMYKNLSEALISIYNSQIYNERPYDKALNGRRLMNAVFDNSKNYIDGSRIDLAIDLKKIIEKNISIDEYVSNIINKFKDEKEKKIKDFL